MSKDKREPRAMVVVREFAFEGWQLPVFEVGGVPYWIAQQVGAALGYGKDGGELVTSISKNWRDAFVEGDEVLTIRGKKLQNFKRLAGVDGSSPSSHTPSLMLLTESGVTIAAVLSRKLAGKRMRRWLANKVMPQIARDGHFAPDRRVVDGKLTMSPDMVSMLAEAQRVLAKVKLSQAKASVLRAQAMLCNTYARECREKARASVMAAKSYEKAAKALLAAGKITESDHSSCLVHSADPDHRDQRAENDDGWRTAAELGERWGVPEQEIREVAERLGLHDDPRMSRPVRIDA